MTGASAKSLEGDLGFARAYGLVGAAMLLALLPGFLIKIGTERVHPLDLGQSPRPDGSVIARTGDRMKLPLKVEAIRIGDAPWRPPGALAIARDLTSLPPGTVLQYRGRQGDEALEQTGTVTERRSSPTRTAARLLRAFLAIVLSLTGAALVVAGADRRTALGGASLVGLGVLFGTVLLEPALVQIRDERVRNLATVLWQAYPRDCAPFVLVRFLELFPGRVRDSHVRSVSSVLLLAAGLVTALLLTLAQIPGALDSRLGISNQVRVIRLVGSLKLGVVFLGAVVALSLLTAQRQLYRRLILSSADRMRARILGWTLLAALACGAGVALIQGLFIVLSGQKLIATLWITLAFLPLLLVPVSLSYALLARDVRQLPLAVHRSRLFVFSDWLLAALALAPLIGLLVFFYVNRGRPLAEVLGGQPALLAGAGVVAILALLNRERARTVLDRIFFRDRANARRLMGELAEKSRKAKDPASLEQLLSGEISRALHAESVALFVRERTSHTFVCPSRSLPTLDVDSVLVGAAGTKGVLELDPADRRSPLATLPEIERHWVEESHARLLLPLIGADGNVIGLLTVGENLSELPWEKEDKSLLVAAAASGALALENSLLRSSGGAPTTRPAVTHEEEDLARSCHLCSQIFSSALGPLCPKDQVPLTVADVPHVLAGKYRFERRIGSGGMGVVYLARDLSLGRHVAVKTLPKVSPEAAMRLRHEARATARVLHPNLAVIFAAETWHGTPMLILEYLEGGTLAPRIARGPIPIESVVEWGVALSVALEAAHAKGVLHRDIKPSNIGFTASGEPKLLDFGLASLLEEPELLAAIGTAIQGQDMLETTEVKQMTGSGRIVGTVPYLAPEAILGESPQVSFDLWSLALTLYEATTGRNPFFEMPAEKTLNRILSQTPPRARSLRADCPEELSTFFANALARNPASRPRTAREFHRALRRLASDLAA